MPSTNIYQPRHSTIGLNAQSGDVGLTTAVYVNTNESLAVGVVSSIGANATNYNGSTGPSPNPPYEGVTIGIDVRILSTNNGLQYMTFVIVPTADYVWNQFNIKLPEGFLLNASAYTQGKYQLAPFPGQGSVEQLPVLGQAWVSLSLVVTANPNQLTSTFLTQGYVTNNQRLTYPTAQPLSYQGGATYFRYLPGTVITGPGNGQIGYNCPLHAANEIVGISLSMNTLSSVGTRNLIVSVQDFQGSTPTTQINSVFYLAVWQVQPSTGSVYIVGAPGQVSSVYQETAMLRDLYIRRGQAILVQAQNLNAGDTVSDFTVIVREWLMP